MEGAPVAPFGMEMVALSDSYSSVSSSKYIVTIYAIGFPRQWVGQAGALSQRIVTKKTEVLGRKVSQISKSIQCSQLNHELIDPPPHQAQ